MRQVMLTHRAQEQLLEHTLLAVYQNLKSIESAAQLNQYFDTVYRIFQDREKSSIINLSLPCSVIRRLVEEYSSWTFSECHRFIDEVIDGDLIRITFYLDAVNDNLKVLSIDVETL